MFELKGARSARIPAGKLLLWRRRLTGAINRSGPYKISEAVLLVCGEKGVKRWNGTPVVLAGVPPPFLPIGGGCVGRPQPISLATSWHDGGSSGRTNNLVT